MTSVRFSSRSASRKRSAGTFLSAYGVSCPWHGAAVQQEMPQCRVVDFCCVTLDFRRFAGAHIGSFVPAPPVSLAAALRNDVRRMADAPGIFLSMYGQDNAVAWAWDMGAAYCLVKALLAHGVSGLVQGGVVQTAGALRGRAVGIVRRGLLVDFEGKRRCFDAMSFWATVDRRQRDRTFSGVVPVGGMRRI